MLITIFFILWVGSIIKCEIITLMYVNDFTISDEVAAWVGGTGKSKVIEYSDHSAKIYYYYMNDYFAYEISYIRNNNIWHIDTWKVIWSSGGGSADDFLWPYMHHSPVGIAILISFGTLATLITVIIWRIVLNQKRKSEI